MANANVNQTCWNAQSQSPTEEGKFLIFFVCLFSVDDIIEQIPVLGVQHAFKVYDCLCEVFTDLQQKVWSSSKYIITLVRTVSINAFYPHMLCILIITVYFAKNNDFSMAMIFQYLQLDLALICPPLKEFDKM